MKKLFLFFLFLEIASATSIGVIGQMPTINALKGIETNAYITLFNPNDYDVRVKIESNSEWIKQDEIKIAAKQSKKATLHILVPANTQNGLYDFILLPTIEQQQEQVKLTPALGI